MSEAVRAAQAAAMGALSRASAATGVDFSLLVDTARRESGFDATARAATSSAAGMFQFVESTWLDMLRRYGAKHGLEEAAAQASGDAASRRAALALRDDPEIAACMAGELTKENAAALQARIGRAPTAGELYAAHVLGAGDAAKLIAAAQRGEPDASALLPRPAAANPALFQVDGRPRSAAELLARLTAHKSGGAAAAPIMAEAGAAPSANIAAAVNAMLGPMMAQALLRLAGGAESEGSKPEQALWAAAIYRNRAEKP